MIESVCWEDFGRGSRSVTRKNWVELMIKITDGLGHRAIRMGLFSYLYGSYSTISVRNLGVSGAFLSLTSSPPTLLINSALNGM